MHDENGRIMQNIFSFLNLFVFSRCFGCWGRILLFSLSDGKAWDFVLTCWSGIGLKISSSECREKAFVMNRIGDLGFLIAIFAIISHLVRCPLTMYLNRRRQLPPDSLPASPYYYLLEPPANQPRSLYIPGFPTRWPAPHRCPPWSMPPPWWLQVFIWLHVVMFCITWHRSARRLLP